MTLDHLWAGWRGGYVAAAAGPAPVTEGGRSGAEDKARVAGPEDPGDPDCVFCRLGASGPPAPSNGVLWRGDRSFAVLNAYPYASGHLMVAPLRHVDSLESLADEEADELWRALRWGVTALQAAYRPEGVNLGANLGRAAGAGIPRHLHLHAVPRWVGDTNFTTAVAGIRVLPEALPDSWARLHGAWPRP